MNNLPKRHGAEPPEVRGPQRCGAPRGAGPPEERGPQRRGAQCSCVGCIGLRPALLVMVRTSRYMFVT